MTLRTLSKGIKSEILSHLTTVCQKSLVFLARLKDLRKTEDLARSIEKHRSITISLKDLIRFFLLDIFSAHNYIKVQVVHKAATATNT